MFNYLCGLKHTNVELQFENYDFERLFYKTEPEEVGNWEPSLKREGELGTHGKVGNIKISDDIIEVLMTTGNVVVFDQSEKHSLYLTCTCRESSFCIHAGSAWRAFRAKYASMESFKQALGKGDLKDEVVEAPHEIDIILNRLNTSYQYVAVASYVSNFAIKLDVINELGKKIEEVRTKKTFNYWSQVVMAAFRHLPGFYHHYNNVFSKNNFIVSEVAAYLLKHQFELVKKSFEVIASTIPLVKVDEDSSAVIEMVNLLLFEPDASAYQAKLSQNPDVLREKAIQKLDLPLLVFENEACPLYIQQHVAAVLGSSVLSEGKIYSKFEQIIDEYQQTSLSDGQWDFDLGMVSIDFYFFRGRTQKLALLADPNNKKHELIRHTAQLAHDHIVGAHEEVLRKGPLVLSALKVFYSKNKLSVRPLSIWLSTVFSGIALNEKKTYFDQVVVLLNALKGELKPLNKLNKGVIAYSDEMMNLVNFETYSSQKSDYFTKLVVLCYGYWVGSKKFKQELDIFSIEGKEFSTSFPWLHYQRTAIYSKITPGNEVETQFDELTKKTIQQYNWSSPWIDYVALKPAWEDGLQRLLKFGSAIEETGKTQFIWVLNPRNTDLVLKEQKKTASGNWSPGREISAYDLHRNKPNDKHDKHSFLGVSILTDNYDYKITMNKMAAYLIDHPRIYLGESSGLKVTVEAMRMPLVVQDNENGDFTIGFKFDFDRMHDGIVHKISPTRYGVIELTEKHKTVRDILDGHQITIPKEAKDKLTTVVEHLSQFIEVQVTANEIEGGIPELPTDARIYAHLIQIGGTYLLEFFTKPIKEIGTYCQPGIGDTNIFGLLPDQTRAFGIRNLKQENANLKKLMGALTSLEKAEKNQNVFVLPDLNACLQILLELKPAIENKTAVLEWPRGKGMKITSTLNESQFSINVKSQNNWFEMTGAVSIDEERVLTLSEMINQVSESGLFIELKDGEFLAVTAALARKLRQLQALSRDAGKSKNNSLLLHPLAAPAIDDLFEGMTHFETDQKWKDMLDRVKASSKKKYPLPKSIKADLRSYQVEGFQWLSRLADWGAGACLADDMGLGKTLQVQALLTSRAKLGPALIVAPASVVRNWVNEINRFTPNIEPVLYNTILDREASLTSLKPGQALIVTYNLLQRDIEGFSKIEFDTIVLDEAQAIKNAKTKRAEVVRDLKGNFRIITTGTPIENHLGEFWSLFDFINPGLLGSDVYFQKNFLLPIERDNDEPTRDSLRKLIQPFILRRLKKDYLKDLPAKTEITLSVEMSAAERSFYEALRRQAVENIESLANMPPGQRSLQVLSELMRLRQACCNSRLVNKEIELPSAKLTQFLEIVEELRENGHRPLVFSQFVGHLHLLREALDDRNIKYQYLDGSTATAKRQTAIDAFQNGEGDLFLISLKAGGAGINLTAADYVIHMDPWWNPAVEDQATDRAHRMGQTKPVTVYRIIAAGTIEEKIVQLHERKRELAETLLEGTDASTRIDTKELIALLETK